MGRDASVRSCRARSVVCPLLASLFLFATVGRAFADNNTWSVLVNGLPANALAGDDMTVGSYYLIKQTQEPLFRKDDGQNFTSKMLKEWGRNQGSSVYKFYPDERLVFDSGVRFTADFLRRHLDRVNKNFGHRYTLAEKDGCVSVEFEGSQKGYLDFLTRYETAPKIKISEKIEEGLGSFRVTEISTSSIVLDRRARIANGYNKIILYAYQGPKDPRLGSTDISDYNLLPEEDIPDSIKKEYVGFGSLDMKVQYLLINVHDKNERDLIYNCIDVDKFRSAFMPAARGMFDVATIFPVGMPGGEPGRPVQKCGPEKRRSYPERVFVNYRTDNAQQLHEFFEDFHAKSGIRIKIANYTPSEVIASFYKKPKAYDLVSMTIGALNTSHYTFLSSFLRRDNIYLDVALLKPQRTFLAMENEGDPNKKAEQAIKAERELLAEHVILPLYQQYRKTYYPSEIKNLVIGKEFMAFPEVGDFRW